MVVAGAGVVVAGAGVVLAGAGVVVAGSGVVVTGVVVTGAGACGAGVVAVGVVPVCGVAVVGFVRGVAFGWPDAALWRNGAPCSSRARSGGSAARPLGTAGRLLTAETKVPRSPGWIGR